MKSTDYKFYSKIDDIFEGIDFYEERSRKNEIIFSIEGSSFRAEMLWKLSELLNTTDIQIYSEVETSGSCPTCDYGYATMCFECKGVDLNEVSTENQET